MDKMRFHEAVLYVTEKDSKKNGIGTYKEKTLHAAIKKYFSPYGGSHETRIGSFIADIVNEKGITEIQTGSFDRLRKKLEAFLSVTSVKVVYPIPHQKWLITFDDEKRKSKRRKSPLRGSIYDIFPELYKIKQFLPHKNLSFCIMLIDMEELRLPPDKNGRGKRKGFLRYDRIPLELCDEIIIESENDWQVFIPDSLAEKEFTSDIFATEAKISVHLARTALNVLESTGIITRKGKNGNNILWVSESSLLKSAE